MTPAARSAQVLTQQQRSVYLAVASAQKAFGYSPTVREIGAAVGLTSSSTVWHHLRALRDLGLVDWVAGVPRTLRVTKP